MHRLAARLLSFFTALHHSPAPIEDAGVLALRAETMTSAYPTGQRSSRNNFVEPPSLVDQISDYLPSIRHNGSSGSDPTAKGLAYRFMRDAYAVLQLPSKWQLRRIFNVTNLFIALWVYTIWWGERSVFQRAIESCHWSNWETWVSTSYPKRHFQS